MPSMTASFGFYFSWDTKYKMNLLSHGKHYTILAKYQLKKYN